MWTATISNRQFVNDNYYITVYFDDGGDIQFEKNYSPPLPYDPDWLTNEVRRVTDQVDAYKVLDAELADIQIEV